ncbi:MAG: oxygenase MpaB family protein [Chthoniobacterales bacterium]
MSDPGSDFLFPPDSQIWRLSREHALLLGGPAAAILQVAHAEVAAGVAAHSSFRADAIGRLHRTLDAVYTITFATRADADAMSRRIAAIHAKVRGTHPVVYDAFSPAAQMWVVATLIGVGTWVFEQVGFSLTDAQREAHYRDMRIFGQCFGLSPDYGPQTASAFNEYYSCMLAGSELASIPLCGEVAQAVAIPLAPTWLRLASTPFRGLVAETLPSPVRERLGFHSTVVSRAAFAAARATIRSVLPILPASARFNAHYRAARRRMAA